MIRCRAEGNTFQLVPFVFVVLTASTASIAAEEVTLSAAESGSDLCYGEDLSTLQNLRWCSPDTNGTNQQSPQQRLTTWGSSIVAVASCEGTTTPAASDFPPAASGVVFGAHELTAFSQLLGKVGAATGLAYNVTQISPTRYLSRRYGIGDVLPNAGNPGPYDFWMVSSAALASTQITGAFQDLLLLLEDDPEYRHYDIPPSWRLSLAAADPSAASFSYRRSLPLTPLSLHLFYRADLLAALNVTGPPASWDELLDIAQRAAGRDLDGDGQPEIGICADISAGCGGLIDLFLTILASIVQLQGPQDGVLFDPDDLRVLAQGPPLHEAVRIMAQLRQYGLPDDVSCEEMYDTYHARGRCLMTLGSPLAFKLASHSSAAAHLRGQVLTAALPGSSRVLYRDTGALVACTPELCPYAQRAARPSSSHAGECPQPKVLVNQVAWWEYVGLAVNAYTATYRQAAAFVALSSVLGPEGHRQMVLNPTSEVGPIRTSELDPGDWLAAGYELGSTKSFLSEYIKTFTQGNVVRDPSFPGAAECKALLEAFVRSGVLQGEDVAAAEAALLLGVQQLVQVQGGSAEMLPAYRRSLGTTQSTRGGTWQPPVPPPAPLVGQLPQAKRLENTLLLAVVLPAASSVVLVVLVLMYRAHLQGIKRAVSRRLDAPGPGCVVLCVTDIQDSTTLWETLSADVCQRAIQLHHSTIRHIAALHHGYESATEGDSFILAFCTAADAARFALRTQTALLEAAWPPELLASPLAATTRVAAAVPTVTAVLGTPVIAAASAPALAVGGVDVRGMLRWATRSCGPSILALLRMRTAAGAVRPESNRGERRTLPMSLPLLPQLVRSPGSSANLRMHFPGPRASPPARLDPRPQPTEALPAGAPTAGSERGPGEHDNAAGCQAATGLAPWPRSSESGRGPFASFDLAAQQHMLRQQEQEQQPRQPHQQHDPVTIWTSNCAFDRGLNQSPPAPRGGGDATADPDPEPEGVPELGCVLHGNLLLCRYTATDDPHVQLPETGHLSIDVDFNAGPLARPSQHPSSYGDGGGGVDGGGSGGDAVGTSELDDLVAPRFTLGAVSRWRFSSLGSPPWSDGQAAPTSSQHGKGAGPAGGVPALLMSRLGRGSGALAPRTELSGLATSLPLLPSLQRCLPSQTQPRPGSSRPQLVPPSSCLARSFVDEPLQRPPAAVLARAATTVAVADGSGSAGPAAATAAHTVAAAAVPSVGEGAGCQALGRGARPSRALRRFLSAAPGDGSDGGFMNSCPFATPSEALPRFEREGRLPPHREAVAVPRTLMQALLLRTRTAGGAMCAGGGGGKGDFAVSLGCSPESSISVMQRGAARLRRSASAEGCFAPLSLPQSAGYARASSNSKDLTHGPTPTFEVTSYQSDDRPGPLDALSFHALLTAVFPGHNTASAAAAAAPGGVPGSDGAAATAAMTTAGAGAGSVSARVPLGASPMVSGASGYASACGPDLERQLSMAVADAGVPIYRGLRVRIGFHCGCLGRAEVAFNRASQRTVYSGPVLQAAKAIADAGRGGQITASAEALALLDHVFLHTEAGLVLHSGLHVLREGGDEVELFSVFSRALLPRAVFMGPPRSLHVVAPGVLSAPLGYLAVAVVQLQDVEVALQRLEPGSTEMQPTEPLPPCAAPQAVYAAARARAQQLANEMQGYLTVTGPGALQAVFVDPEAAIRWILALQQHLEGQAEAVGGRASDSGSSSSYDMVRGRSGSGLMLRGGVDVGLLQADLSFDGRMLYSGPACKVARELALHALWREVLVSYVVARSVLGEGHPQLAALKEALYQLTGTGRTVTMPDGAVPTSSLEPWRRRWRGLLASTSGKQRPSSQRRFSGFTQVFRSGPTAQVDPPCGGASPQTAIQPQPDNSFSRVASSQRRASWALRSMAWARNSSSGRFLMGQLGAAEDQDRDDNSGGGSGGEATARPRSRLLKYVVPAGEPSGPQSRPQSQPLMSMLRQNSMAAPQMQPQVRQHLQAHQAQHQGLVGLRGPASLMQARLQPLQPPQSSEALRLKQALRPRSTGVVVPSASATVPRVATATASASTSTAGAVAAAAPTARNIRDSRRTQPQPQPPSLPQYQQQPIEGGTESTCGLRSTTADSTGFPTSRTTVVRMIQDLLQSSIGGSLEVRTPATATTGGGPGYSGSIATATGAATATSATSATATGMSPTSDAAIVAAAAIIAEGRGVRPETEGPRCQSAATPLGGLSARWGPRVGGSATTIFSAEGAEGSAAAAAAERRRKRAVSLTAVAAVGAIGAPGRLGLLQAHPGTLTYSPELQRNLEQGQQQQLQSLQSPPAPRPGRPLPRFLHHAAAAVPASQLRPSRMGSLQLRTVSSSSGSFATSVSQSESRRDVAGMLYGAANRCGGGGDELQPQPHTATSPAPPSLPLPLTVQQQLPSSTRAGGIASAAATPGQPSMALVHMEGGTVSGAVPTTRGTSWGSWRWGSADNLDRGMAKRVQTELAAGPGLRSQTDWSGPYTALFAHLPDSSHTTTLMLHGGRPSGGCGVRGTFSSLPATDDAGGGSRELAVALPAAEAAATGDREATSTAVAVAAVAVAAANVRDYADARKATTPAGSLAPVSLATTRHFRRVSGGSPFPPSIPLMGHGPLAPDRRPTDAPRRVLTAKDEKRRTGPSILPSSSSGAADFEGNGGGGEGGGCSEGQETGNDVGGSERFDAEGTQALDVYPAPPSGVAGTAAAAAVAVAACATRTRSCAGGNGGVSSMTVNVLKLTLASGLHEDTVIPAAAAPPPGSAGATSDSPTVPSPRLIPRPPLPLPLPPAPLFVRSLSRPSLRDGARGTAISRAAPPDSGRKETETVAESEGGDPSDPRLLVEMFEDRGRHHVADQERHSRRRGSLGSRPLQQHPVAEADPQAAAAAEVDADLGGESSLLLQLAIGKSADDNALAAATVIHRHTQGVDVTPASFDVHFAAAAATFAEGGLRGVVDSEASPLPTSTPAASASARASMGPELTYDLEPGAESAPRPGARQGSGSGPGPEWGTGMGPEAARGPQRSPLVFSHLRLIRYKRSRIVACRVELEAGLGEVRARE